MTRCDLIQLGIAPALSRLPEKMNSLEAIAMLVAIADQETDIAYRHQIGGGPGRGWWQFEPAGVHAVLTNALTRDLAAGLSTRFGYKPDSFTIHTALADNDVLCATMARLLLWSVPKRLPGHLEVDEAWSQYLWAWRPGKPRRERWNSRFHAAWKECKEPSNWEQYP